MDLKHFFYGQAIERFIDSGGDSHKGLSMIKGKTKRILTFSFIVSAAIVFSTSLHEVLHLVVGRMMGVPANFLNMTAVGIPNADVDKYPGLNLLFMNGIAPLFSMFVFGGLGYFYLQRCNIRERKRNYFIAWITMLNFPYVALQLMMSSTRVRFNGTGNDFAAVAGFFGVPIEVRSAFSIIGYVLFLILLPLLGRVLMKNNRRTNLRAVPKGKRFSGLSLFTMGFGAVCVGNWMLLKGNSSGMWVIVFGALIFATMAFLVLLPWKSHEIKEALVDWLLPGFIGSIALIPIGIADGNDYEIFWLVTMPIALGAVFFSSNALLFKRS